jgi:acetylornithine deacetylase/succinyl-diaminopimelate desuccinylase-like protein
MSSPMDDIHSYIDAHVDDSIAELLRLVAQPSVSAARNGFDKAPGLVKSMLEEAGLEAEIWPTPNDGLPSVFGNAAGGSKRTLLFYTHYDVQPPEPLELWESDPFKPERRGDRIFGRGISDDKGNIAARLAAIRAFREVRGGLPSNLKFFVEGEEEIGSVNLPPLVDERADALAAEACIWEGGGRNSSGRPSMYLGLKGLLYIELSVRQLSGDAHSSYATILPSAPWRLLEALQTLREPDGTVLIPGFYDDIRPTTPEENAAIYALPDEESIWAETFGNAYFNGELTGAALRHRLLMEPTANIDGIWGGYQGAGTKTVLPAEATAKMDLRLVPDQRPGDIFRKLRAHLDSNGFSDIEIEVLGEVNPSRTPMDSAWARLVAQTHEEVYGQIPVIMPSMAGTGPMYQFADTLGIPIATSGIDHPSHKIHAPNENIRIDDFLLGAKHAATVMQRFAERADDLCS